MGYIFPCIVAMEPRIDPAEEARHREVMHRLGVYDAVWSLSKVLEQSDVQPGQNRLLLTKETVRAGPIPKVFPELEELRDDGLNAEHRVPVTILDAEGREKELYFRYLNSNKAYPLRGLEWRRLVQESSMSTGDRIDLIYTCGRSDDADDERCLFVFRTQGGGAGAGGSLRSDGRKRKRSLLRRNNNVLQN